MKPFSKKLLKADIEEETPEFWENEDRGSKEISKYDEEYDFLVRLINLVTKEGVPPQEIKALSLSLPFKTINDVVELTAQIWTLATEKYQIPREWLIKKLPEKKGTLKKADLWPAQQESSNGTITQGPGQIAYNPEQEKDLSVSGPNPNDKISSPEKDAATAMSIAKDVINQQFFEFGNRWSEVVKAIRDTVPLLSDENIEQLKSDVQMQLNQLKRQIISKKNKKSEDFSDDFSDTDWHTIHVVDAPDPFSSPEDHGAKPQQGAFPSLSWQPAGQESEDEQPWSNIATNKRPFSKKASPKSRYWIAPDGKEFEVFSAGHGAWIKNNYNILKQYGTDTEKFDDLGGVYNTMYNQGWTRISNEGSGFVIEVNDLRSLPRYLDSFIAKNFSPNDAITIGDRQKGVLEITDPFPSIQKAVNKALRQPAVASLKQADLSGQVVNNILKLIRTSGGVTYNLSQGNLAGTDNYAVSIYPDREQILDAPVDFDTLEGYLEANQDLLTNANNSFGTWTNGGKTYLDVVVTTQDKMKALNLARVNDQLAIWDLKNNKEIPTGIIRAMGKNDLVKQAAESILTQEQQDEIASAYGPVYNIALQNYGVAARRGHGKDRAVAYAVESVSNLEKINDKKLVELINTYLVGLI